MRFVLRHGSTDWGEEQPVRRYGPFTAGDLSIEAVRTTEGALSVYYRVGASPCCLYRGPAPEAVHPVEVRLEWETNGEIVLYFDDEEAAWAPFNPPPRSHICDDGPSGGTIH
jgi:hypothetical protein